MLHYLLYRHVRAVLIAFREKMKFGSMLFLGLSEIRNELGRGYSHYGRPVQRRFGPLEPLIAAAHRITMPICLYRLNDACRLVESASFCVVSSYTSTFGNLKLVAKVI